MKKFLLAAFLALVPAAASAQCSGVFAANTVCGRGPAEANGAPHQIPGTSLATGLVVGTTAVTGGSPSATYQSFLTNNNGFLANGHIVDIGPGIYGGVATFSNNFNVYTAQGGDLGNGIMLSYGTGNGQGEGGGVNFFSRNIDGSAIPTNQELGFIQAYWWTGAAYNFASFPLAVVFITTEAQTATNQGSGIVFQAKTRGEAAARGEVCIAEGLKAMAAGATSCQVGLGIGTINGVNGIYDNSNRVLSASNLTAVLNQNASTLLSLGNNSAGASALAAFSAVADVASVQVGAASSTYSAALFTGRSFIYANSDLLIGSSAAKATIIAVSGAEVARFSGTTPGQLTLGVAGSIVGKLALANANSGSITLTAITGALGTIAITVPATTGTLAVAATSPVTLSATTGTIACATCVTSSGGGAISGTAPISVSAGGVVSINAPYVTLTASMGGIVYSGSTNLAILAGTATARQMLQSGASTTPAWSTTTWPATTTINRILYSSSASVIGEITTTNSSILVTDSGGIPSLSTTIPAFTMGGNIAGGGNAISNLTTLAATTSLTSPLLIGGSGTTGTTLEHRDTSGNGTTDQQIFTGGNNGATRIATMLGTGLVGFGSAAGAAVPTNTQMVISRNATTVDAAVTGVTVIQHLVGNTGELPAQVLDSYGAVFPLVAFRAAGGTAASKTAITSGSRQGSFLSYGWDGSAYGGGGLIAFFAGENFSGTNHGSYIDFQTVALTTTTQQANMRLQGSGGLSIGNAVLTTDPGSGGVIANGATIRFTAIASDTAQTDNSVCINSTGVLLKGTGALGVCLGTSGAQFKTAFAPMEAGINDLIKIDFQTYRYRNGFGDSGAHIQYGATAQNIETALPDLVRYNNDGEAINYDSGALLFIGLRAIQQLKADNDNLRLELKTLAHKKG